MKNKIVLAITTFCLALTDSNAQPASISSISFQGALNGSNGLPLTNGNYNLSFRFWDGPAPGGNPVSTNILVSNVLVSGGIASTAIPVNPSWFNGQTRYLGISVNGGSELLPRVLITAVPYAITALNTASSGTVMASQFQAYGRTLDVNSNYSNFPFEGEIPEPGVVTDFLGFPGSDATFGRILGDGNDGAGFGVFQGPNVVSPVIWMYGGGENMFAVKAKQYNALVNNSTTILAVRHHGGQNIEYGVGIGTEMPKALLHIVGPQNGLYDVIRFSKPDGTIFWGVNSSGETFMGHAYASILTITGGADLAEHLNVNYRPPDDEYKVEPGMVVSIDSTGNRKFKLADAPYDRKRVGIISGGNGVSPGLVLRDEGNPQADGDQPVALTGQVWVHADAAYGAITPGDLLTTSATPGHAMRVSDDAKARFAVLGQALTGLAEGRGWVQVLVRAE